MLLQWLFFFWHSQNIFTRSGLSIAQTAGMCVRGRGNHPPPPSLPHPPGPLTAERCYPTV